MDRRDFLLGAGALSVVLANRSARADQASRRILLLVELKGGNDGLNTVIPYANPHYHALRNGIGVPRERIRLSRRGSDDRTRPVRPAQRRACRARHPEIGRSLDGTLRLDVGTKTGSRSRPRPHSPARLTAYAAAPRAGLDNHVNTRILLSWGLCRTDDPDRAPGHTVSAPTTAT